MRLMCFSRGSASNPSAPQSSKGFSLIEILVTLVILSIGLLGLASMQVWSLKNSTNSNYSTLATFYAYDMAERMRSNKAGVEAGAYDDIPSTVTDPGCGTSCTSAQVADLHAFKWNEQLKKAPENGGLSASASGTVRAETAVPNSPQFYVITVTWSEQDTNPAATDSAPQKTFSMRVSI